MERDWKELTELLERIGRLPVGEQVFVMEMIAAGLRKTHFTDHAAAQTSLDALANSPAVQGELYPWTEADAHAPR